MQPSAQGTDLWRQGLRVFPALGGTSVSQALGSAHSGLLALHFFQDLPSFSLLSEVIQHILIDQRLKSKIPQSYFR